jgi:PhnB protein
MKNGIKGVPDGYHTLTPHLTIKGASQAMDFYKRAFGAEELGRAAGPDGQTIMHGEMRIGDSRFFLNDEFPEMGCRSPQSIGGSPVTIHIQVEAVDTIFNQAVAAGAKVSMPLADMFWGDRYGKLIDPFGHEWSLATHQEDVPPEELAKRAQAAFANCAQP